MPRDQRLPIQWLHLWCKHDCIKLHFTVFDDIELFYFILLRFARCGFGPLKRRLRATAAAILAWRAMPFVPSIGSNTQLKFVLSNWNKLFIFLSSLTVCSFSVCSVYLFGILWVGCIEQSMLHSKKTRLRILIEVGF